ARADQLDEVSEFRNEHPHVAVLTVSPNVGVAEFAASIRAGASSVVAEDASVENLMAVLEHITSGMSSAPMTIMHALAVRVAAGFGEALSVEPEDLGRIRALANGSTVSQIAAESGFSEREMFRLLNTLYGRLGVKNRTEAILWASRHGFLDDMSEADEPS
ncbi:MAG: response regulator transcription factor, partial [Acidimicrobiia bacterium]|nr:response regulator transcription factor [Acidimicrobiia bacterium]